MSPHRFSASIIVVSSAALADPAENRTGPVAEKLLVELGATTSTRIVGNDADALTAAVRSAVAGGARLVLTCGGTGIRAQDITVEATEPLLDKQIPGISEEIRRVGRAATTQALLSRGLAGTCFVDARTAIVVNAPGSRGGVTDAIGVLAGLIGPLLDDLDGIPRH